ncbi:tRNA (adenine(22)-N(1))-methyltransferase [Oceanobacillus halophilus]|uniref:tRNA (Adenine-N(1))-methyltransferase n=1 Tax=Oceanobacillus halophilus TaxID=930130 RepID=A0A495AE11_9BACI|nr:tRNA (adenine(22)-N(1))-methyltransferase TrmK [Oceanobacillus halophilus]RKQ37810.1 tRNA (adenine-N(1))-methyltransferase [Oceanobacillus halophilus]
MVKSITLSTRLATVASYIKKGAFFADIGSDHAYLPCYVCMHDDTARAIAGEVNKGPFKSAIETVDTYKLSGVIDVRLGNGLEVISPNEGLDHLIIAGMGGTLIKSILAGGKSKLENMERIIAQPNVDAKSVRKWLRDNHYFISDESIVKENGHIYEIIVADKIMNHLPVDNAPTDKELLFGPVLLRNKSKNFFEKWKHEHDKLQRVINQMKNAKVENKEKIIQFEEELSWMEEVLQDEKFMY